MANKALRELPEAICPTIRDDEQLRRSMERLVKHASSFVSAIVLATNLQPEDFPGELRMAWEIVTTRDPTTSDFLTRTQVMQRFLASKALTRFWRETPSAEFRSDRDAVTLAKQVAKSIEVRKWERERAEAEQQSAPDPAAKLQRDLVYWCEEIRKAAADKKGDRVDAAVLDLGGRHPSLGARTWNAIYRKLEEAASPPKRAETIAPTSASSAAPSNAPASVPAVPESVPERNGPERTLPETSVSPSVSSVPGIVPERNARNGEASSNPGDEPQSEAAPRSSQNEQPEEDAHPEPPPQAEPQGDQEPPPHEETPPGPDGPHVDYRVNIQPHTKRLDIASKEDFLKNFHPPEYVVDGVMQRGFVYSLTGATGSGKTAIALLLNRLMGSTTPGQKFGPHTVEKGIGVYFSGENSDDMRMRIIGDDALRTDNPADDHLHFIDGVFDIKELCVDLQRVIRDRIGQVDLVTIDTSAAYFLGQDENSNPQMGEHARMIRTLTKLPGKPAVLVLCHPIKHATQQSELLPRGGGAFLAEVDGNFTAWPNPNTGLVEFHWAGKLRGPGFEPILFRMDGFTVDELTDRMGRKLPTVRALHVSDVEEENRQKAAAEDYNRVLIAMYQEPGASIAGLATKCGWTSKDGQPTKSKVDRILQRLKKERPPLVKQDFGKWGLTEKGTESAKKAAEALGNQPEG